MYAPMGKHKEIKLGRIAGPFHFPPFLTLRISPISVILKRSSSEYRLIHNLSFPEHGSFNDFIDKELCFIIILMVSVSMPKNTKTSVGSTVLSFAKGTPHTLQDS
jgi:hypothetical protein